MRNCRTQIGKEYIGRSAAPSLAASLSARTLADRYVTLAGLTQLRVRRALKVSKRISGRVASGVAGRDDYFSKCFSVRTDIAIFYREDNCFF